MSLLSISDYEEYASNQLEKGIREYLLKGAQNDVTLEANVNAFKQFRIRPRYMIDVSKRDLTIKLFGNTLRMPIAASPFGRQKRFHENAELETARGIKNSETLMIVNCISSTTLEDIASSEPDLIKWFQMFVFKDRNITLDLAKRAENSGYKAIVLTVDFPVIGLRYCNERNNYINHLKPNLSNNYTKYSVTNEVAQDATWDDIKLLKSQLKIPLILKGILTVEDAKIALQCGVDGIIVSNHGGRQLDDSPATLEVLPEIVDSVGDKIDVYIDGGVRSGNDVFKALAIGAKAVFVGRPVAYGLIHDGSNGVKSVLNILYKELDNAMALSGCKSINDIKRSHIQHIDRYRDIFKRL